MEVGEEIGTTSLRSRGARGKLRRVKKYEGAEGQNV